MNISVTVMIPPTLLGRPGVGMETMDFTDLDGRSRVMAILARATIDSTLFEGREFIIGFEGADVESGSYLVVNDKGVEVYPTSVLGRELLAAYVAAARQAGEQIKAMMSGGA